MDSTQKNLLNSEVEMLKGSLTHLQILLAMQPYDPRAVESALKSIESQCAFMRQYSVSPREISRIPRDEAV